VHVRAGTCVCLVISYGYIIYSMKCTLEEYPHERETYPAKIVGQVKRRGSIT
jgi:hypothetical protein